MSEQHFNLLTDPVIRVRNNTGETQKLTLPGLYAALMGCDVKSILALRPNQQHSLHAFLAQLAVIAIDKGNLNTPPKEEAHWRSLLQGLTTNSDPWCLVNADHQAPAFLQSPSPTGLEGFKNQIKTPDDLDVLVSTKNHNVKQSVAHNAQAEDWIFALISLQTSAGYMGRGNYGIARMNGGFSSRPCLGLAPVRGGMGSHLKADIIRMLDNRQKLLDDHPFSNDGKALLWLEEWDGEKSLKVSDLDPYFIEVCRQVRVIGLKQARTKPAKNPRIDAKPFCGVLGDFWTPVQLTEDTPKAFSISSTGFRYDVLAKLLFNPKTHQTPESMDVSALPMGDWRLIARGISGGQGKTEGYYERTDVVFKAHSAQAISQDGLESERLTDAAQQYIKEIKEALNALRMGVAVIHSGGKAINETTPTDRQSAKPQLDTLDARVNARYFADVEERFLSENQDKTAKKQIHQLINEAEALMMTASPPNRTRRHQSIAKGLDAFYRCLSNPKSEISKHYTRGEETRLKAYPQVAKLAARIARLKTGPAAALRRGSTPPAYWRLCRDLELDDRWAPAIQATAILTPKGTPHDEMAHNPTRPFGRAIHNAGVSERRLAQFLNLRPKQRAEGAISFCRRLVRTKYDTFNLHTLVWYILDHSDAPCLEITRDYYNAMDSANKT